MNWHSMVALGSLCAVACSAPRMNPPVGKPVPSVAPAASSSAAMPPAPPKPKAIQVVLGNGHGCVLKTDGEVWCWGSNRFGQLGQQPVPTAPKDISPPVRVLHLPPAKLLAAAARATCAIVEDGSVHCWGRGRSIAERGSLFGSAQSARPVKIDGLEQAVDLALGYSTSCAVLASGAVTCWKQDKRRQLEGIDKADKITVSVDQICIKQRDGQVLCADDDLSRPFAANGVTEISTLASQGGRANICGVHDKGSVTCWPARWMARELKVQDAKEDEPFSVPGVSDARQVVLGRDHSCVLKANGKVLCWGKDNHGQLGRNRRSFTRPALPGDTVHGIDGAVSIAASYDVSCAVLKTGAVQCWGRGHAGLLGAGYRAHVYEPVRVPSIDDAIDIGVGSQASCALRKTGELMCWGLAETQHYEDAEFRLRANKPQRQSPGSYKRLWSGGDFVLGETAAGTYGLVQASRPVVATEQPAHGELLGLADIDEWGKAGFTGFAVTSQKKLLLFELTFVRSKQTVKPQAVKLLPRVISADLNMLRGCAVKDSGDTVCFETRKLKDKATKEDLHTIEGLDNASRVVVGLHKAAVIHRDGGVSHANMLFGFKDKGRRVAGIDKATDLALEGATGMFGCAVHSEGALSCWGDAPLEYWEGGRASVVRSSDDAIPSWPVAGIQDAKRIEIGEGHACVLHNSGGVSCWGQSSFDQTGADTPGFSATPVEVLAAP